MWLRCASRGSTAGCLSRLCSHPRSDYSRLTVTTDANTLLMQCAGKGDYGFNVFHNSNPQHGGSYARHERRMREDEVEDFLLSVKGWVPVEENCVDATDGHGDENKESGPNASASSSSSTPVGAEGAPTITSRAEIGDEAIKRTFTFNTYREAYLFMGRVWAFCYGSDKYPHVVWEDKSITVYLYSPSFRGLSKREARVAAFLNDQFNMLKKSRRQQEKLLNGVARQATIEEIVGEEVKALLAEREARRHTPVEEVVIGPTTWDELMRTER